MVCDEVRRALYFFLDQQLGDRQQDVSQHLSLCPECEQRSMLHKKLRTFVQKRLDRVCAPERLRTRLSRTIRAAAEAWNA